jgi:outer membrane protein OmpA-like peptidoglycan-associated protein
MSDGTSAVVMTGGGTVSFAGFGFIPGTKVDIYVFSKGTLLGTAVVKADGSYSITVPVPSSLTSGNHTAQVQGFITATTRTGFSVGVVVKAGVMKTVTISHFASGSSKLTASMRRSLAKFAASIVSNRVTAVTITGFNDNVGTKVASLVIGRSRAVAVMKFLRSQLQARRYHRYVNIHVVTLGAGQPVKSNTTAAGKAANRRVVLQFTLV